MIWWEGHTDGGTTYYSYDVEGADVEPGESGYINVNWPEVTWVQFNAVYQEYGGASIDNLKFNEVPLPGAVWLLGSGLLGLIGVRRFRKG